MYNRALSQQPDIQQKVRGASLDECKQILYNQFKTDYVIVDHRIVMKPRLGGLISPKPIVEATYIIKENSFSSAKASSSYPQNSYINSSVINSRNSSLPNEDFTTSRDNILKQRLETPSQNTVKDLLKNAQLAKQLEEISNKIDNLSQQASVSRQDEHPTVLKIEDLLKLNEFTSSYIDMIKARIRKEFSIEELNDFNLVKESVADWIGENIKISEKYKGKTPHVIIIVGPTGVGKTTTIAKMASKVKYIARKNNVPRSQEPVMHMITIDSMRVAALDQLEHYGDALEVSVEKAKGRDDLETLYRQYNDPKVNFIFIDTSGFSPNDNKHIADLVSSIDIPKMHADIFLAVSATTKARDLEKIIRNYEQFDFRSVIITKCDETSSYGNILSVLYEKGKSISWLTTGQEVLNTLEPATEAYFLKNLDGFDVDEDHILNKFPNDTTEDR